MRMRAAIVACAVAAAGPGLELRAAAQQEQHEQQQEQHEQQQEQQEQGEPAEKPEHEAARETQRRSEGEREGELAAGDRELLSLLLALTDPDDVRARARAATGLGKRRDARGQRALRYVLAHDDDEVRVAAARALGAFRGPRVEAALAKVLLRSTEPADLRIAAARSLGAQQSQSAAETLWQAREDGEVGGAASRILQRDYAEFYQRRLETAPRKLDRRGRALLMTSMGLHGGYFMTALAEVAGGEPGVLSFLGGASVGAITPYLLSLDGDLLLRDAVWISSTTTWGWGSGLMISGAAEAQDDDLLWSSIGGQVAGLLGGLISHRVVPFEAKHTVLTNLGALAGMSAGAGVVLLDGETEKRPLLVALQLGMTGGLIAGGATARSLELDRDDWALVTMLSASGAWVGGWAPGLANDEGTRGGQHGAGALLGVAAGYAGSLALSQFVRVEAKDTVESLAGGVWGSAMGGGVALMAHRSLSLRPQSGLVLAGGALGALGAGLAAGDTDYSGGQGLMAAAGTGWGVWQGLGFAYLTDADGRQRAGAALVGGSSGGALSALAAHTLAPTPSQVGIALSGGAWGGWLGGWGTHVLRKHDQTLDSDDVLLATLLGSDAGLLLGALAVSRWVDIPQARLGWINMGGLLGMGLGTSIAAVFAESRIAEGNLIGTSAGLAGTAIVTGLMGVGASGSAQTRGGAKLVFTEVRPGVSFIRVDPEQPPIPMMMLSGTLH